MKAIVVFGFKKLTDDGLSTKANHIVTCMNGNTNFPDATALVTAVSAATTEYDTSLAAAKNGGRLQTALKNKDRKALEKALKALGLHVQLNCKDDVTILLSSGFDARKDNHPTVAPGAPANFMVKAGKSSGSIVLSVNPYADAKVYVFQWASAPVTSQTTWETVLGKHTITIRNLVPGKEYAFRAAIKGAAEELNFSEIVTHFAA